MATNESKTGHAPSNPGRSQPTQSEPPATVRQDLGRPPAKPPERPDNIAENPVGKANPPVDQR
jgi:hypothetical protein